MFVGAVPLPVVNQLLQTVDFAAWSEIFVCCSGSFRVDRALKGKYPDKTVRGNDVSLLSCALGAVLTGREFDIKFKGRLEFVEGLGLETFDARLAAVLVGLKLGQFSKDNDYAAAHFAHIRAHFTEAMVKGLERVQAMRAGGPIDDFFAGDFRDHAQRAMDGGHGIAGFMPTYKNGYERLYRFIGENVEWAPPAYRTWDPKDLPDWLAEVGGAGSPYFIVTDHELPGMAATTEYRSSLNKPVYGYASRGRASFRRVRNKEETFAYTPVVASELGPLTDVQLVPATSAQMTFLRNAYLAKGIAHTTGLANYLVLLDGKLAGGFIFNRDKWKPQETIYLLSDFCIVHERRLAKLVAMLACSREAVHAWCKRFVMRPKSLCTTAFTDAPVSMKYRGIYELTSRKPGRLQYEAQIGEARPAKSIYLDWLGRFGGQADHPRGEQKPRRVAHGQEKRAVHAGGRVQPAGVESQA
jgi:hypothetical protein